jgi:FAD/FMN-containing dehydrogenase
MTLGGGYGPLMGKYGLVADNLVSAEVVTADGRVITANAREHPDLFWGLRGGGGNFGVVLSFEYRLHPITQVLAGLLFYPLEQAAAVLERYADFIETAPDALTIQAGFVQVIRGTSVLFLSPVYCGALDEGERAIAPLRTFGAPLADLIRPIPYGEVGNAMDAMASVGRRYCITTQSLARLRPATIAALVQQAQLFTSPYSAIALHHFHGAASRVGASDTAFALRQDHLMVEFVAAWERQSVPDAARPSSPRARDVDSRAAPAEEVQSADEDRQHDQWAHAGSWALAPHALRGGYVNFLTEGEQARVRLAYGDNHGRLRALKRRYDPEDVFRSTIGHIVSQHGPGGREPGWGRDTRHMRDVCDRGGDQRHPTSQEAH